MTTKFEEYLQEVASRTWNEGGSASNPFLMQFLQVNDVWCFPKYPSRTIILPSTVDLAASLSEFVDQNKDVLCEEDCWLGTWQNPQTGEYYLDVATGIGDFSMACETAQRLSLMGGRQIVAMYNPLRKETYYLREE